jgi:hypothetical protein
VPGAAKAECKPDQWTRVREHVLECLHQAEGRLLSEQTVLLDDDEVRAGLTQDEIVQWHITEELDRCAAWPYTACSHITICLISLLRG